jgi:putative ABC transport system permease protein
MLSLRLLWRNWRSGEVKILAGALTLAVAVVSAISVFTDRLETALVQESAGFMGADTIVGSSQPFPSNWQSEVIPLGVEQANTVEFVSMVFSSDTMNLASVKAVSDNYPLRGKLQISDKPFAVAREDVDFAESVPAPGEAWIDSRLLPLLEARLGDEIQVGDKRLRTTKVIVNEPDRGGGLSMISPRLIMNERDLAETNVIQPGSRVYYRWLISGNQSQLDDFAEWVEPNLTDHQRILDLEGSQQRLAEALDRGKSYLLLAGIVGVLLAGVAIAIAAQHFAGRHVDQVALMKSLGAGANRVRWLYGSQLLWLASMAAVVGLIVGEVIQQLISTTLQSLFPLVLEPASIGAYAIGVFTGFVCLIFFAMPPLWHLPTIPPIKILRRELVVESLRTYSQGALGLAAILLLILIYSGDFLLTLAVFFSLLGLIIVASLLAHWMLNKGRQWSMKAGSVWRLALASLQRNRGHSTMQILVFATAIMLLLALATIRTSLIDDWQLQLPEDAPNHIFLNIAPNEIDSIAAMMQEQGVESDEFSPMVRGRLTHLKDEVPNEELKEDNGVLRRELNLSWSEALPEDNEIIEGKWWDEVPPLNDREFGGVSIEKVVAERLDLSVGDKLRFSIAGLTFDVVVDSIRTVNRDSFEWYIFLIQPGILEKYSPMYRSDVFLPPEQKMFINEVLLKHPTVMVFEFDKIIEQIRAIVDQVTRGVELVLWLVVACGFIVLLAAVNASMSNRLQESGLLRALGSRRQIVLGSVWAEFSTLGLFAGAIATIGCEILLLGLQYWFLDVPLRPHALVWISGVVIGTVVIGALGVFSCRRVISAPPAVVLREVEN